MRALRIPAQILRYLQQELALRTDRGLHVTAGIIETTDHKRDDEFHIVVHDLAADDQSVANILSMAGDTQRGIALHILYNSTTNLLRLVDRPGRPTTIIPPEHICELYQDIRSALDHAPRQLAVA